MTLRFVPCLFCGALLRVQRCSEDCDETLTYCVACDDWDIYREATGSYNETIWVELGG